MFKKILVNGVETLVRLADNATIPNDPANSDYQAFLKWQKLNPDVVIPVEVPVAEKARPTFEQYMDALVKQKAGDLTAVNDVVTKWDATKVADVGTKI